MFPPRYEIHKTDGRPHPVYQPHLQPHCDRQTEMPIPNLGTLLISTRPVPGGCGCAAERTNGKVGRSDGHDTRNEPRNEFGGPIRISAFKDVAIAKELLDVTSLLVNHW